MKAQISFSLSQLKFSDSLKTTFKLRYRTNYDFIYNMYDGIREMREADVEGNEFIRDQSKYEMIHDILGDWPVSNREICALAFTLREFGVIDF